MYIIHKMHSLHPFTTVAAVIMITITVILLLLHSSIFSFIYAGFVLCDVDSKETIEMSGKHVSFCVNYNKRS